MYFRHVVFALVLLWMSCLSVGSVVSPDSVKNSSYRVKRQANNWLHNYNGIFKLLPDTTSDSKCNNNNNKDSDVSNHNINSGNVGDDSNGNDKSLESSTNDIGSNGNVGNGVDSGGNDCSENEEGVFKTYILF